jgi:hypothetical protein
MCKKLILIGKVGAGLVISLTRVKLRHNIPESQNMKHLLDLDNILLKFKFLFKDIYKY